MLAIIGSGPSGLIGALHALNLGESVTVLDIGSHVNQYFNQLDDPLSKKAAALKSAHGSFHPYDLDEYLVVESTNFSRGWFTSKARGGFSLVWGATWGRFKTLNSSEWIKAYQTVDNLLAKSRFFNANSENEFRPFSANTICSCLDNNIQSFSKNYLGTNELGIFVQNSKLLISKPLCSAEGDCAIGCSKGAIWSSEHLLSECMQFPNFRYIEDTFVTKVKSQDLTIVVETSTMSYTFEKLVIACGPVASSAILLRSELCHKNLTLSDTQMIYVPFLKMPSSKKHKGAFALSQYSVELSYEEYAKVAHIQLYVHLEKMIGRLIPALPHQLIPFFQWGLSLFSKCFGIALIYIDPLDSDELVLEWNEKLLVTSIFNRPISTTLKHLKKSFKLFSKRARFLPLWKLVKVTEVGASYHLGAAKDLPVDEYGRLLANLNIGIAGALALPFLEPGPITNTAMAQSVRLISSLFPALPKS